MKTKFSILDSIHEDRVYKEKHKNKEEGHIPTSVELYDYLDSIERRNHNRENTISRFNGGQALKVRRVLGILEDEYSE